MYNVRYLTLTVLEMIIVFIQHTILTCLSFFNVERRSTETAFCQFAINTWSSSPCPTYKNITECLAFFSGCLRMQNTCLKFGVVVLGDSENKSIHVTHKLVHPILLSVCILHIF